MYILYIYIYVYICIEFKSRNKYCPRCANGPQPRPTPAAVKEPEPAPSAAPAPRPEFRASREPPRSPKGFLAASGKERPEAVTARSITQTGFHIMMLFHIIYYIILHDITGCCHRQAAAEAAALAAPAAAAVHHPHPRPERDEPQHNRGFLLQR